MTMMEDGFWKRDPEITSIIKGKAFSQLMKREILQVIIVLNRISDANELNVINGHHHSIPKHQTARNHPHHRILLDVSCDKHECRRMGQVTQI